MIIEFKKLRPNAIVPTYGSQQAAGADLYACIESPVCLSWSDEAILIPTGIAIHMDYAGMVGLIFPRSGLGHKQGMVLGNGTGVIDSDYQGEIFVSAWNRGQQEMIFINPGDRIAQIVFMPRYRGKFIEVDDFAPTERGAGGFGSTGK